MVQSVSSLAPGVSFLSIPDDRFKTSRLTAALFLPLREETAAAYALLPALLTRSCARFPTMAALGHELARLYGARISGDLCRLGDQQVLLFTAVSIDDRYALRGEPVMDQCAQLLLSMLFEPVLENGVFRQEDVEQERRCLLEEIEAEINDKRRLARRRCLKMLYRGDAGALDLLGTKEQVQALTAEQVTAAWREALDTARIQWICQGSADGQDTARTIGARFADRQRTPIELATRTAFDPPAEIEVDEDTMPVNQSKLVLGFRVGIAEPDPRIMAARLMNALLGGTPHSLLFRHVREDKSLCYYCASSYDRLKGSLLVDSGVEAARAQEARTEIARQLEAIRRGHFTDEELESARRSVANQFREVDDLQSSREGWYLGQSMGSELLEPEEAIRRLATVTREEVQEAARLVTPVCVYLLRAADTGEKEGTHA